MEQLKNKIIILNSHRVVLRTLVPDDVTLSYVLGINDPEVNKYLLLSNKGKQTTETISAYVKENFDSINAFLLGIFLKHNNELVGTIRLSNISSYHYCCDIGICMFMREYWGKGFARESIIKTVDFAFNDLGLHYIEAGAFTENTSSVDLFLRCGFKLRCSYTDKLRLKDKFAAVSILNIINPNFDSNKLSS